MKAFKAGAEWREYQIIEKAIKWIKENYYEYCREIDYLHPISDAFDIENFMKDFKQVMNDK